MLVFSKPTLVTLTAPTCAGKNFLRDALEDQFGWSRLVSTTTRAARAGEIEGQDYFFISEAESKRIEEAGEFAELIEFLGVRYGVTTLEMTKKMGSAAPPLIILEPQGLQIYRQLCKTQGWDMFSIFISAPEDVRLSRLIARTVKDLRCGDTAKVIAAHTKRVLSITSDERCWITSALYDVTVSGIDLPQAVAHIEKAVAIRNAGR